MFFAATDRCNTVSDFAGGKRETDGVNASALSSATLEKLLGSALTSGATGRGVVEPIIGKD
jgi:hypothetical protein